LHIAIEKENKYQKFVAKLFVDSKAKQSKPNQTSMAIDGAPYVRAVTTDEEVFPPPPYGLTSPADSRASPVQPEYDFGYQHQAASSD
jgi:hypothetical protein